MNNKKLAFTLGVIFYLDTIFNAGDTLYKVIAFGLILYGCAKEKGN